MDTPYALVTINGLCLLLYLASLLLVKMEVIRRELHIKVWNAFLLIFILGTGLSGILLAVQVNFKLDMPVAGQLLKWHVNLGIGLFIISLIHFSRHFRYYLRIFHTEKQKGNPVIPGELSYSEGPAVKYYLLLPFVLGTAAMSAQIMLIREMIALFRGNEWVIGILLTNWLLLTSLGAWTGKKSGSPPLLPRILVLLVVLPVAALLTIFLADLLRNLVFTAGSLVGMLQVILFSLILLAPFCFLSGWTYSRLSALKTGMPEENQPAAVYGYESLGSMAGGVLVNLVLVFLFRPFVSMLLVCLAVAALVIFISLKNGLKRSAIITWLITLAMTSAVLIAAPDRLSRKFLFPGQEISAYEDTPYGSLVVTTMDHQQNTFLNGSLLFTTNDIMVNEESVHYAMLQHPAPVNVLIVENGVSGVLNEVLKYPVKSVHYVEMNPWILKLGKQYPSGISNSRVYVHRGDIREYLRNDTIRYDVVCLLSAEPSTLLANRFYTLEFFRLLKPHMTNGAYLSLGMMPTPNYSGDEARNVQSVILSTLARNFRHIEIIPGEKNYFIASDQPIDIRVAALSATRGIPTEYVNPYYLDDEGISRRSNEIRASLSDKARINTDMNPAACYGQLLYRNSYFGQPLRILLLVYTGMMILLAFRSGPVTGAVMTAGFTASSLEMSLLLVFQILFGNLYLMAGIFILVFMAGMFTGTLAGSKVKKQDCYTRLKFLLAMSAALALLLIPVILFVRPETIGDAPVIALLLLFDLVTGIIAGVQYNVASRVRSGTPGEISGTLYSADLWGSAGGALLVTAIFIPLLGFWGALAVIAFLNLLSLIRLSAGPGKHL